MADRLPVSFVEVIEPLYRQTDASNTGTGVLLTACDGKGRSNAMTIGWGLYGWFYHMRPVAVVAVRPACFTHRLLARVGEFVLSVPTEEIREAVAFCGVQSGHEYEDKFAACGLTAVPSVQIQPPSIAECPINIECRVYHQQDPPHMILTPEHRQAPVSQQHTIYFAEVLGAYRWK